MGEWYVHRCRRCGGQWPWPGDLCSKCFYEQLHEQLHPAEDARRVLGREERV